MIGLMLIYMALLQIRLALIIPRLQSPAALPFNRPTRGILPQFNRQLVLHDNDKSLIILIDANPN